MLKKLRKKLNKAYVSGAVATAGVLVAPHVARADATTPTSLIPASATEIITDFAADIVPTAMALIVILVPVGLTLWGIGFAVSKGINFVKSKAGSAVKG